MANVVICCGPLTGRRMARVTERWTWKDRSTIIRELMDDCGPDFETIIDRKTKQEPLDWCFATGDARTKLKRLYLSITA